MDEFSRLHVVFFLELSTCQSTKKRLKIVFQHVITCLIEAFVIL